MNKPQHRSKNPVSITYLAEWLDQIDPDICYRDWIRALMAVYYETGGSEKGFELADAWSSRGQKYGGCHEIRSKWNSFRIDQKKPITIGTLIWMARQE